MARFKHRFRVRAPLHAVWTLYDDPSALKALTPPPLRVRILHKDEPLQAGAHLKFRLVLIGPLGATWHAIYDEFTPYELGMTSCGFVDRSLSSPFRSWVHRHTFEDLGDGTSAVTDDARFELIGGPLGPIITWLVAWPAIAFLFAYRQFQTRRILAQSTPSA
jgi:ligand-binding SRPBCC domain-containing protein